MLIEDMVSRINANRAHAAEYVAAGLIGDGALEDCAGLTGAALDLCEWCNLIRGSAERRAGAAIGSMLVGARLHHAPGDEHRPLRGLDRLAGPPADRRRASPCGSGDALFPDETLRRAVSSTVCVALLRDAASAPVLSRC